MLKVIENKKYIGIDSLLAGCKRAMETKGHESRAYQTASRKLFERAEREKEIWKRRAESIRLVA